MEATAELDVPEPADGVGITPRIDYSSLSQRYVSASAADGGAGTREDPWSVETAQTEARPGTVVNFLDGRYSTTITPPSGREGEPIVFRSAERYGARIDDAGSFVLEDAEAVHVQGFQFEGGDWITLTECKNVVVRDNYMVGDADSNTRLKIEGGDRISVLSNTMLAGGAHNMLTGMPSGSQKPSEGEYHGDPFERVLVAGNSFSRAGHQPAGFYWQFSDTVWRGNVVHNVIGRSCGLNGGTNVVFEHNLVANAFDGPKSYSSKGKFTVREGILRFNKFVDNKATPLVSSPYDFWNSPVGPIRAYHNVFADNDGSGWTLFDREPDERYFDDVVVTNNVFDASSSDAPQLEWSHDNPRSNVRISNNLFEGERAMSYGGEALTVAEAESRIESMGDNLAGSAAFMGLERSDVRLGADSAARNGGSPLTRTTDEGRGTEVPLEDARYFHDGFDVPGVSGDPVRVGDETARVVAIDRDGGTITVDRDLAWEEADPVGLPWQGPAPSMGPVEGGPGLCYVGIEAPRVASVHEEVTFSLRIEGEITPEEIAWQFGDGGGTTGETVTHSYAAPYDYGVRVRIRDTEGRYHWGTHYIYLRTDDVDPSSLEYTRAEIRKFISEEDRKNYR